MFPKMPPTQPPAETAAERSIMMRMAVRMAMTMKTPKKMTMAIDGVDVDDDYDGGADDNWNRAMLSDDYDDHDHCHDDGGSSGAASMTSQQRADGRT